MSADWSLKTELTKRFRTDWLTRDLDIMPRSVTLIYFLNISRPVHHLFVAGYIRDSNHLEIPPLPLLYFCMLFSLARKFLLYRGTFPAWFAVVTVTILR